MANLGEVAELVNASEANLKVSADTYIMLKELVFHVGRVETRDATTGAGAQYNVGKGDNWFTGVMLVTTPEFDSLNTLTQTDANGDITSTAWLLEYKNTSGATKTAAATGYIRDYDVTKPEEGKVRIEIFVRITGDTVTIS